MIFGDLVGLTSVMLGISEQIYSVIMLSAFFVEVGIFLSPSHMIFS